MTDWTRWPYHRPGSALTFPRDAGWHRLLPGGLANPSLDEMEWTYLNAHVSEVGGEGRHFVVFAAYFTQGLRFLVVRTFDDADRQIDVQTGTAWGLLRASAEHMDLTFSHGGGRDTWVNRREADGRPIPFSTHLSAVDDAGAFGVELDLTSTKAPYEAGGTGHMPFGKRGAFFYYSLTRLQVEGALELPRAGGGKETVPVTGLGWFDHQWGPFYVTPFRNDQLEEYEWMSVQLDSSDELMLTTVWEASGETPSLPAYGGVGLVRADGTWEKLVGAHRWKRTRFWHAPEHHTMYSAGWTVDAPEWDLSLEIRPRADGQLTPIVDAPPQGVFGGLAELLGPGANYLGSFWEGSCRVSGTFEGRPVTGVAFGELIKRYEHPQPVIEVARNDPGLAVIRWRVRNPDEQVPLRHRFYLEQADGTVLVSRHDIDLPVVALDDPALPRGTPLVVRVVSHCLDGSLAGTATTILELR